MTEITRVGGNRGAVPVSNIRPVARPLVPAGAPPGTAPARAPAADPVRAPAPQEARPEAPHLSPGRRAAIDSWLAQNRDATGGFWIFADSRAGARIGGALRGASDLGRLNSAERSYLAEQATAHFAQGNRAEVIRETADAVRDDPVAAAALARAYAMPTASDERHFASGGTTLNSPEGNAARGDLLEAAVRLDPAAAASAFAGVEAALARRAVVGMDADAVTGLMRAVADRRVPAEAADRLVSAVFVHATADHLRDGPLRAAMADALAMVRRPGTTQADAAARANLSARLDGLIATGAGRDLLFDANIRPELRAWAFGQVMQNPGWTADTLRQGWQSDAVATAFAAEVNARFAAIPAAQPLTGNALRNTVGQAIGATPDRLP